MSVAAVACRLPDAAVHNPMVFAGKDFETSTRGPVRVPEERWVEGHVLHMTSRSAHRLKVHRTRVARPDRNVALAWGGNDAYVIRVNLTPLPAADIQQGESFIQLPPRGAMQTTFMDVRDPCAWAISHAIDQITFELPKVALGHWAEDHVADRTMLPDSMSGQTVLDPVLKAFGLAAASVIALKDAPNQFFVDHLFDGLCSHLLATFGTRPNLGRGGLAAWQVRRAKDMIDACGASDLSLSDLASSCGLSVAHFSRAFRQSCGMPPHQWMMSRRIERADKLLRATDMSLASIAIECGFTDQAHLTNLFTRRYGSPPGALRRRWRSEAQPSRA